MALRTWCIRGVILAVLALVGYGIWLAQSFVSPDAVRKALLATLTEQFPNTDVTVGRADIRIFGGISVRDLTLTRRGESKPYFTAPRGTIFHDKEQLNNARIVIRKIELDQPTLHVTHRRDGSWSLDDLTPPSSELKTLPMFVITRAKATLFDERMPGLPPLQLENANVTIVNDPAPNYLAINGTAIGSVSADVRVPVSLKLRLNRITNQAEGRTSVGELPLDPLMIGIMTAIYPDAANYLEGLSGRIAFSSDFNSDPQKALQLALNVQLRNGRYSQPKLLPMTFEQIALDASWSGNQLTIQNASARWRGATLGLSLHTRPLGSPQPKVIPPTTETQVAGRLASRAPVEKSGPIEQLEEKLERLTVTVRDLAVDDSLFEQLPAALGILRTKFSPTGAVSLDYRFTRPTPSQWLREAELKPSPLILTYEKFRYPLHNTTGEIRYASGSQRAEEFNIDLVGEASGRQVTVKGRVHGGGIDPTIQLTVSGQGVPIDDRIFDALPKAKYRNALKKLRAVGVGDFVAEIKQTQDINITENTFRVTIQDGTMNYTQFPYPLERVKGKVLVRVTTNDESRPIRPGEVWSALPETDVIELRNFEARHGEGYVWIKGDNVAHNGSKDRKLTLNVWGKNCPIDGTLKDSLESMKIGMIWDALRPQGKLTFALDAEVLDRAIPLPTIQPTNGPLLSQRQTRSVTPVAKLVSRVQEPPEPPFNPITDLKVKFTFEGPTVTPEFFEYRMTDLAGRVEYDAGRVRLERVTAAHGSSKLSISNGEILFYDDGQIRGDLSRLNVAPLIVDEALIRALPKGLREGVKEIRLRGPAELSLKQLVVLTPPDPSPGWSSEWPTPAIPRVARGQAAPPSTTSVDPDVYWNGEIRLVGAAFDAGVPFEQAFGKFGCIGRYYPTHLGQVVGTIWLDSALIASHPITQLKASFEGDPQEFDSHSNRYRPPVFRVPDISGQLFSGRVGGTARVVLSDPTRYKLALTATDIRLEDVARHHNLGQGAKLEGAAQAYVVLEAIPDATGQVVLSGEGTADVDRAHLLNLPMLLPLLKTLKFVKPDKAFFEEAHATFRIRGDRVMVDHLDLLGSAISLGGVGETDIRGQHVKFDCYVIVSQTLQRWLTTPFGDITAALSQSLFKIEVVRRADGKMDYIMKPVPIVTEPIRKWVDRVKQRMSREPVRR